MSEHQTSGGDVAVVTGAGQGIGYAIAERFSAAGATVIITDINEQTGSEAARKLGGQFIQLDVSDSAAITRTAKLVHQQHGRIDVLVNNAGIAHENDAIEVTDEIWESVLAVDLRGTFVACREFGRYFIQQRRGSIVNISSIAAFMGTNPDYHVAYDVAKAGVSQLVRSLAVEWAQHGVRVNAVAPGRTRTPILDGVGLSDPTRMQQWIDQIPQRRLLSPEEIAEAVFFLGQEQSSAVTGQTLIVDGGQLAA